MIYLFLSIVCSTLIFIIFRSFEIFKVNRFTAIVINYFVAGATGIIVNGNSINIEKMLFSEWSVNGLILGVVFITLFNIMAYTAQKLGASVASIANKMALIIPVAFAILVYGDTLTLLKGIGIILALVGVFFATMKQKDTKKTFNLKLFAIPIILFFGSGFIDTFLKYTQEYLLKSDEDSKLFASLIFLTAFSIGSLIMLIDKSKRSFKAPSILGGLVLGIVNFGSISFLIQALEKSNLESSVVFPINNMGVVICTTILSFLIFKEQFSTKNKIGIALSVLAIAIITLA